MKRLALLLLLLPLLAEAEIHFLTLKHRNAEQLIPLLQPVLDEGIGISGRGPTLIVNSQPRQLEEVRRLVERLDTPLQSLLISVTQAGTDSHSALGGEVRGTQDNPAVRLYGSSRRGKETVRQQLRVIEGQWAFIRSGMALPIRNQTTIRSHHGTTTHRSVEYRDVESGFEVRPRISGDTVTLEVRPFHAKRSNSGDGVIEQQELSTTVSGRLGEWLTIGDVDEQQTRSAIGTIHATGTDGSAIHNVKLKVEALPN